MWATAILNMAAPLSNMALKAKASAFFIKTERQSVAARPLDEEEVCCVCCDELNEKEDLSHCLFGCGH